MSKESERNYTYHDLRRAIATRTYREALDSKSLRKFIHDHFSTEITQIYINSANIPNNSNSTK